MTAKVTATTLPDEPQRYTLRKDPIVCAWIAAYKKQCFGGGYEDCNRCGLPHSPVSCCGLGSTFGVVKLGGHSFYIDSSNVNFMLELVKNLSHGFHWKNERFFDYVDGFVVVTHIEEYNNCPQLKHWKIPMAEWKSITDFIDNRSTSQTEPTVEISESELSALRKDREAAWEREKTLAKTREELAALLQSVNAERLRAEAEVAEVARIRQLALKDPVVRMNNICAALEEEKSSSPYSAEAWEQADEDNRKLRQRAVAAEARAEAMAKDAGRLQTLADASGQFYEQGYGHHMIGRLREYIDSEKAAIDTAIEQGAQHG